MKRFVAALAAVLLMAGPAAAKSFSAPGFEGAIPENAKILLMQPDVELSELGVAGMAEPKADWSRNEQIYLNDALQKTMKTKAHELHTLVPADAMVGRPGQLLRLHDAVGQSILDFTYGYVKLPTKTNNFDWTLGEGAQELATKYDADYALFTHARGTFSSGGRMMLSILAMSPTGAGQMVFMSLVDLKTGKVVWFNFDSAGGDMRSPTGSDAVVANLLKDAPL